MPKLNTILWIALLSLLCLPLLFQLSGLQEIRPLQGYFAQDEKPELNLSTWMSGAFQEKLADYERTQIGFRPLMVRLYNQWDYSLCGETSTNGVVIGQDEYLYEEVYINSLVGKDYAGQEKIDENVSRYEAVADTLKKLGTEMLFLLAPGKAAYYPEYLPATVNVNDAEPNNYLGYSVKFKEQGLNFLDCQQWFRELKGVSKHPLVSKTGIHWSRYGEVLVADSLLNYMRHTMNLPVPRLKYTDLVLSDQMQHRDDDVEQSMNLLFDIPDLVMAYPTYIIEDQVESSSRVLTISDSYYWGLYPEGFSSEALSGGEFWYYGKEIYPEKSGVSSKVSDIEIAAEVSKNDVVLFISTDYNLNQFGYGIIDKLYEQFYLEKGALTAIHEEKVRLKIEEIKADANWYEQVKKQAEVEGVTIEQSLRNNAEYVIYANPE